MRWLFAILLVFNVIFIAYYFSGNDYADQVKPSPFVLPGETAVNVAKAGKSPVAEVPASVTGVLESVESELEPEVVKACYRVGPFLQSMDADRANGDLSVLGFSGTRKSQQEKFQDNYLVYLPPQASKSEAIRLHRELKTAGILDNFVISHGLNKNGISLGLFSNKEKAKERYALVVSKGHQPLMETRPENRALYWLHVLSEQLTEEEARFAIGKAVRYHGRIQIIKIKCS